jgi:hypothetical protein
VRTKPGSWLNIDMATGRGVKRWGIGPARHCVSLYGAQ